MSSNIDFTTLNTGADANGWQVIAFGTLKIYRKTFTVSGSAATATPTSMTISGNNLPSGMSNLSGTTFLCSLAVTNGNAWRWTFGNETALTNTQFSYSFVQNSGSTQSFTGNLAVIIFSF